MAASARRFLVTAACALGALGVLSNVAMGAFTVQRAVSQGRIATLALVAPASAGATTTDGCATVSVSWSASADATAYAVEVRVDGGAWLPLATTSGATSVTDSAGRANSVVAYRVFARHASSGWQSPTAVESPSLTCGIQRVVGLAAANPCSSTVLGWSAPAGANNYDVQRRVGGGAWSVLASDQSATSYVDATQHAVGALVEYQVRSGNGTANGAWSSTASIASWDSFRVTGIQVANAATLGVLNAGDSITVTFSKPAAPGSVTSHSIVADNAGSNSGLYLATTSAGTGGIGRHNPATSPFGATATYAGVGSWSNGDATYRWTSSVAGTTMSSALAASPWTAGLGVRCAADNGALQASAPTVGGRW